MILAVVLIVLILGVAGFILTKSVKKYEFNEEFDGIVFSSDLKKPSQYLKELGEQESFIASPVLVQGDLVNSLMLGSANVFNVVFIQSSKRVENLWRELDSEKKLISCTTNLGDPKKAVKLSLEECSERFSNLETSVLIKVEYPNKGLEKSIVVLQKNQVTIYPKEAKDVERVSVQVMNLMYGDASEKIENVNDLVDRLFRTGKLGKISKKDSNS